MLAVDVRPAVPLSTPKNPEQLAQKAWNSLSDKNYSPFFDIRKSRDWYSFLKNEYGLKQAQAIGASVISNDFYTQAWEAIDGRKPCEFGYRIVNINGQQRLVHESDIHNNKDISEGVTGEIRRGRERVAIKNFRLALLESEVGTTVIQASPMKHPTKETQKDCYYPDTFFTIAQKVSATEVRVRQFKSRLISPEQAAEVVNRLVKRQDEIKDPDNLDSIIETAAKYAGSLTDEEIIKVMEDVSGVQIEDGPSLEGMKQRSQYAAQMMMRAFEEGHETEALKQIHAKLIIKVLGEKAIAQSTKIFYGPQGQLMIQTNCGTITSGESYRSSYFGSSFMGTSETGSSSEGWHEGTCVDCKDLTMVGGCDLCKKCEKKVDF
jgi:hypothetical protein